MSRLPCADDVSGGAQDYDAPVKKWIGGIPVEQS
jgi:hypothetical protein